MRPEDVLPPRTASGKFDVPIDVDLASLDGELLAAGAHARRSLHGRTQPTRVFSVEVRAWLLERFSDPAGSGPPRRQ